MDGSSIVGITTWRGSDRGLTNARVTMSDFNMFHRGQQSGQSRSSTHPDGCGVRSVTVRMAKVDLEDGFVVVDDPALSAPRVWIGVVYVTVIHQV